MAKVTRLTLNNSGELDRRRLNLREISGDADAPLESVGQDLRKARERKGEELDHIARVLKIRQDYLAAIEESAMEALPGRTYAIGFVRSYATHLGPDGEDYVQRLMAEVAGRGDGKETPQTMSRPGDGIWLPQGIWLIAGLLIVALLYVTYYLLVSVPRISEQPVIPVPERLAAAAGLPPAAPVAESPRQAQATPASAPAPRAVAGPLPTPQAVQQVPLPPGRRFGVQNTGSRITLRAHRASRVTVQNNNRMFINRALAPGDIYLVPNVVGLRLSTPDSGAIELILDGSSLGF